MSKKGMLIAGTTTVDMITSEMEKLRSLLADKAALDEQKRREAEEVTNEMKLLVDFLIDKKLEEGSCRLNFMMSEVVEMAREAHRYIKNGFTLQSIKRELKDKNYVLRELEKSQNGHEVGEGDGDMVGFEEDVKLLLQSYRLKEEEHKPIVVCICGIAGSGKTTLVRHLYNHADIVQNSDHRVWVDCKEILSHKELLVNLLGKLPRGDAVVAEEMESAHLQMCVVQRLQGKRFFLVLDDPRRFWLFQEFLASLHTHVKGRCILLFTCRRMPYSNYGFYDYDMNPLDVDKSWELLLKTVLLLSNTKLPKKVERKGKAMLMKHTGGLPLAIKEVAMEWVEKWRLGIEWEGVVESEDLELRTSVEALDSSIYHNLDPDIKSCFHHLSFFKLGLPIRTQRFMDTLFASGVLETSSQKSEYYRCIEGLEREKIIEISHAKTVHISPIFHKLSITKAKKGEDGALHRVIYCSRERFNCSTDGSKQISCLSFNGGGCFDATTPSYLKSFEQLRVLDFEGFGLKFLPEKVGELIELRYLGLRNNYIQELPHSLGNLKKLEVLDIAQNFMVKVPDIIFEMDALVHLYMSDIFCMKPLKIVALKNLETLTYISVDNWTYEVLGLQMMTRLSNLGIEGLDVNSDVSKLFISLAKLDFLICLVLRGFRFKSMPSLKGLGVLRRLNNLKLEGLITKLPSHEDFPPRLYVLKLVNSCVDEDPMPLLEKLPHLKYLKLQNAYTGQQMVISGAGFPRLQLMYIEELWHLRNIQVGGGGLKHLAKLEITSCPYLKRHPKEIINNNS